MRGPPGSPCPLPTWPRAELPGAAGGRLRDRGAADGTDTAWHCLRASLSSRAAETKPCAWQSGLKRSSPDGNGRVSGADLSRDLVANLAVQAQDCSDPEHREDIGS